MNKSRLKKVSVAMTTYNGGIFLKKQLDSILNQTFNVSEIIVCDDGSSDGTLQLLKEYAKLTNLKYFVNEKKLGFVKNFEKALSLCSGELIVLSDQDDIWYSDKVEFLVDSIGDNLLIHSDCDLINEDDEVFLKNFKGEIKTHKNAEDFLFNNVVTGCTSMIHRDLLSKTIPFPEGISYHDWYLAIHAAYLGKITYISKSLTGYRQHSNQDTGTGINETSSLLRNCWYRIVGKEFNNIKSSKSQLKNLRATLNDFAKDNDFHQKQIKMILLLEEYISEFLHFSFGAFYSDKFTPSNKSKLIKLLNQLKFSIG